MGNIKTASQKVGGQVAPVIDSATLNKLDETGGEHLPMPVQHQMETKLGKDLSDVKVHSKTMGQKVCLTTGAKTCSVGNHVCFAPGEYKPFSPTGQEPIINQFNQDTVNAALPGMPGQAQVPSIPGQARVPSQTNVIVDAGLPDLPE